MPYVKETLRVILDPKIKDLITVLKAIDKDSNGQDTAGVTNYTITQLLIGLYSYNNQTNKRSYNIFNSAMGVLGCVAQEFYRRMVVPYEDEKIKENGDVYPTW